MNSLFDDVNICSVVEGVESVIEMALKLEPGRTGGYFCLGDPDTGIPIVICQIGEVRDPAKAERYLANAMGKCRRLAGHADHRLASQSADSKLGRYGGAVKANFFIYSFSGLPELLDEAAMLLVAVEDCALDDEEAGELARKSNNEQYPLLKARLRSS